MKITITAGATKNDNNTIPASATISFVESPCAWNSEMSLLRLEVGGGMLLFASLLLAVVESRLPNITVHEGPPNW